MLRGFATVNYWADDLEAAKGWYSELLGIEPYFERQVGGQPAYVEFRVGDYQHELGLIDSRYAPHGRRWRRRLVLTRRRRGGGLRAVSVHGGEGVPAAHAMGRGGVRHRFGG